MPIHHDRERLSAHHAIVKNKRELLKTAKTAVSGKRRIMPKFNDCILIGLAVHFKYRLPKQKIGKRRSNPQKIQQSMIALAQP